MCRHSCDIVHTQQAAPHTSRHTVPHNTSVLFPLSSVLCLCLCLSVSVTAHLFSGNASLPKSTETAMRRLCREMEKTQTTFCNSALRLTPNVHAPLCQSALQGLSLPTHERLRPKRPVTAPPSIASTSGKLSTECPATPQFHSPQAPEPFLYTISRQLVEPPSLALILSYPLPELSRVVKTH